MSGPGEVWVSDGLPSAALASFASVEPRCRRFPLVGGRTVWDDHPGGKVWVAVASPNRLGVFEPLPPDGWEKMWWWSDPLSADPGRYHTAPAVERIPAAAPLPADRPRAEASDRALRAADYLTRRLRNLRGVRLPSVPHGRRFPILLPVAPAPLLAGVAEELRIPRPVDGWPGLVVCEAGWWQTRHRLDALVEKVGRAARGERPDPLEVAERSWSLPAP